MELREIEQHLGKKVRITRTFGPSSHGHFQKSDKVPGFYEVLRTEKDGSQNHSMTLASEIVSIQQISDSEGTKLDAACTCSVDEINDECPTHKS